MCFFLCFFFVCVFEWPVVSLLFFCRLMKKSLLISPVDSSATPELFQCSSRALFNSSFYSTKELCINYWTITQHFSSTFPAVPLKRVISDPSATTEQFQCISRVITNNFQQFPTISAWWAEQYQCILGAVARVLAGFPSNLLQFFCRISAVSTRWEYEIVKLECGVGVGVGVEFGCFSVCGWRAIWARRGGAGFCVDLPFVRAVLSPLRSPLA